MPSFFLNTQHPPALTETLDPAGLRRAACRSYFSPGFPEILQSLSLIFSFLPRFLPLTLTPNTFLLQASQPSLFLCFKTRLMSQTLSFVQIRTETREVQLLASGHTALEGKSSCFPSEQIVSLISNCSYAPHPGVRPPLTPLKSYVPHPCSQAPSHRAFSRPGW